MKKEISKGIGIFLAVAGLVGVVVQVITAPSSLRSISLLFLSTTLFLLGIWVFVYGAWLRHRASRALPPVKQLEEICTGYDIVPASSEEIDWISRLEAEVYSPEDAVPKHILMEWYNSNPTGFYVIKMSNGQKIGHIDILPLRPATLKTFLEGNIVEKDIRGDSLFSTAEKHLIRNLYVESIIVLPPKTFSNAPAVLCTLTHFPMLVERICTSTNVENVYAIAASKSGERLLKRLGFDSITFAKNRKDHHDFYSSNFVNLVKNISEICGARFPTEYLDKVSDNKTNNSRSLSNRHL